MLPVRSDIQREFNDLVPIQDDFDGDTIKTVSVGTHNISIMLAIFNYGDHQ